VDHGEGVGCEWTKTAFNTFPYHTFNLDGHIRWRGEREGKRGFEMPSPSLTKHIMSDIIIEE